MLIIFDCDGVLIESERLAADVFSKTLMKYSICLSPNDCYTQFRGWTLSSCFAWLERNYPKKLPDNISEVLANDTVKRFEGELRAVEDVETVLAYVKERGLAYCLASNGGHAKIDMVLACSGLNTWFPQAQRFSAEDVRVGKPEPDLFLYASESMGVAVEQCLVIEDSLSGARAAQAADMPLLYFDSASNNDLDECFSVLKRRCQSMAEVLIYLRGLTVKSVHYTE